MNLYLVRGNVERRMYDDDLRRAITFEDIRLVKADSEEAASEKWAQYWNDKGSLYYDFYLASAYKAEVSGVLE